MLMCLLFSVIMLNEPTNPSKSLKFVYLLIILGSRWDKLSGEELNGLFTHHP